MKKFIALISLLFIVFSCSSEQTTIDGLTKVDNSDFEIQIPSNWNILKNNENVLPKPKIGTISLAATSDELKYGFSSNVLILSQKLNKEINSKDFSILNNVGGSKEFKEYTKIESKNIKFDDLDESQLYIFEAKYNLSTPKLKFLQVGKVCSSKGFLLTIAISSDIKNTTSYENFIKTFKCK